MVVLDPRASFRFDFFPECVSFLTPGVLMILQPKSESVSPNRSTTAVTFRFFLDEFKLVHSTFLFFSVTKLECLLAAPISK